MSENPFSAFTPKKEWLVCVDSDGCAMDTMDSKHHQAFCPQLIRVYGLEEYAGLITPHWMEVNLYSRTRGVNRFKGLAATMRMLAEHGVRVPGADELCAWVEKAPKLSNPALEEAVAAGGGAGLQLFNLLLVCLQNRPVELLAKLGGDRLRRVPVAVFTALVRLAGHTHKEALVTL